MIRALMLCALCARPALAHDGIVHPTDAEGLAHGAQPLAEGLPLPFDLGGAFSLVDQSGQTRTQTDPAGHLQLLFFGYANCREICSVALPQMAEIETGLAARGIVVTPVLITVDPVRDTVGSLGSDLAKYSPNFVGLTGSTAALANAYSVFSIESNLVFDDPQYGPVYAHGSFLYLLDGQGKFLTVLPPILTTDRMIEIIAAHTPAG